MKLISVNVKNYRLFDDITINFAENYTFILGENNLGKSSLLDLLNNIFNRSHLEETDFVNENQPIEAKMILSISPYEIGYFNDLIDTDNGNQITIIATAQDYKSDFEYVHEATGQNIPSIAMRDACFFLFKSIDLNIRDFKFDKNNGVGRVLVANLDKYQICNNLSTENFFDNDQILALTKSLNEMMGELPFIKENRMSIALNQFEGCAIGGVVGFVDERGVPFDKIGSGVQYATMLVLQIIGEIIRIPKRRLENIIITDEAGQRILPCIIAYDEPEIHIHPHMQRSLVKVLGSVADGTNKGFNKVLSNLCDIDRLSAQLIYVTHSPNILNQHYENIVRFKRNDDKIETINGSELNLDAQISKQLYAQFDSIKEAFFCRAALIVEGQTELGAYPGFAERLSIDLDIKGAVVLYAGGKKSVKSVSKLLESFGIPCISIVDKDNEADISNGNNITTEARDFEEDLTNQLVSKNELTILKLILDEANSLEMKTIISDKQINECAKRINIKSIERQNINIADYIDSYNYQNEEITKLYVYTWLYENKSILLGKIIGEILPIELIPERAKLSLETLEKMCY